MKSSTSERPRLIIADDNIRNTGGHYFEQHGRLMADPEIVFFIGDTGWVPTEITQVLGGHRIYSILAADGQDVALIDPRRQANLASFAEMWAKNIEAQGWLEHAEKWDQDLLP